MVKNVSDRGKPIWLSIGLGYRQAFSPISTIGGVSFQEEVIRQNNPNFGFNFWDLNFSGCVEDQTAVNQERFVIQHLGQQVELQIGVRFGI